MSKQELMFLLRLLAGMESILLYSGRQTLNESRSIPDYLLEDLSLGTELLEREILK